MLHNESICWIGTFGDFQFPNLSSSRLPKLYLCFIFIFYFFFYFQEKNSFLNYNVSCILTLPPYQVNYVIYNFLKFKLNLSNLQRKGYGRLLIDFSEYKFKLKTNFYQLKSTICYHHHRHHHNASSIRHTHFLFALLVEHSIVHIRTSFIAKRQWRLSASTEYLSLLCRRIIRHF